MQPTTFDDETLMAYADGALEPEEASRVAKAASADPEVAARVEVFRQTGAALMALGASRPLPPLSAELAARVERTLAEARSDGGQAQSVVAFPSGRSAKTTWRPLALAASLALAVGLGGGVMAGLALRAAAPSGLQIALLDAPEVGPALGTLRSGEQAAVGQGVVTIVSSFMAQGDFCREFEYAEPQGPAVVSVACRTGDGWQTRLTIATASPDDARYAPASSLETLDAFLSAIGADAPMSAAEETQALSVPAE